MWRAESRAAGGSFVDELRSESAEKVAGEELAALHVRMPSLFENHIITKVESEIGVWCVDGRQVVVLLSPACGALSHGTTQLMVCDGPLRQPFLDYLENNGRNEVWEDVPDPPDSDRNLWNVPHELRPEFDGRHLPVGDDRPEAMRAARKQYEVRKAFANGDVKPAPVDLTRPQVHVVPEYGFPTSTGSRPVRRQRPARAIWPGMSQIGEVASALVHQFGGGSCVFCSGAVRIGDRENIVQS
eukprot:CAMPEP_0204272740 /NCGR_PEP_ID=MMETSP0468-20130131/22254_1 /ASSEMBLY_ACC=CAM_ASM_000383 /TAXON_ID=2969 /ORGANISM="Oxyrrhis marina" /LENGTH=241 /DNA_ID=CAMNT_0051248613 /DNA_START=20 /DNA_END=745 /DNA_ORIENTATION=+